MANIILTNNSEFKPFTFQERIAPYLMISKAGSELAEKYDTFEEEAFKLEKLAESEIDKDSIAAKRYKDFAAKLRIASSQLDTNFNPSSYSELRDLRREYISNIEPIGEAWESRRKMQEEALEREAKGIKSVSSFNPFTSSIDEFIGKTPNIEYSFLDNNQKSTAVTIQGITSKYYNNPALGSRFGDAFKTITESVGMTPDALNVLFGGIDMNNPIQSLRSYNGEFKEVAEGLANELEKAGYGKFDMSGNQQVFNSVMNGAMQGLVYQENEKMIQNPEYRTSTEQLSTALSLGDWDLVKEWTPDVYKKIGSKEKWDKLYRQYSKSKTIGRDYSEIGQEYADYFDKRPDYDKENPHLTFITDTNYNDSDNDIFEVNASDGIISDTKTDIDKYGYNTSDDGNRHKITGTKLSTSEMRNFIKKNVDSPLLQRYVKMGYKLPEYDRNNIETSPGDFIVYKVHDGNKTDTYRIVYNWDRVITKDDINIAKLRLALNPINEYISDSEFDSYLSLGMKLYELYALINNIRGTSLEQIQELVPGGFNQSYPQVDANTEGLKQQQEK